MGKIIKREVIAYKGMNSDMSCRDFHYEVGKSYKTDKVELCEYGFHACLNPIDVLDYYPRYLSSRYFKVKLSGEITKCGMLYTNVAATKITILEEITIDELNNIAEWWKHENVIDLLYYSDGFAQIRNCDKKYNFINKQGKLLSDEWFNCEYDFNDGFAVVQRGDRQYNFIDKQGKLLSEQWFEWVSNFFNGFAVVRREDNLYNLIGTNGNYLFDKCFMYVGNFNDGFAKVQRSDGLMNFITTYGKLLSDEWFNYVYYFQEEFAKVQRANGDWCQIDKTGNLIKNLQ